MLHQFQLCTHVNRLCEHTYSRPHPFPARAVVSEHRAGLLYGMDSSIPLAIYVTHGVCVCVCRGCSLSSFSSQKPLQLSQPPGPSGSILGPTVAPKNTWWEDQESQDLRAVRGLRNHLVQQLFILLSAGQARRVRQNTPACQSEQVSESLGHEAVCVIPQAICIFKCTVSINLLQGEAQDGEDMVSQRHA